MPTQPPHFKASSQDHAPCSPPCPTPWAASRELFVEPRRCRQELRSFAGNSSPKAGRIYAGIGLAGRALSLGLPVDVLSLICAVEHLRRQSQAETALLLVADQNALAAGFSPRRVHALSQRYFEQIDKMCKLMGLPLQFELASQSPRFALALPRVESAIEQLQLPAYVGLQLQQMAQLATQGFGMKVGWRMPGANRDELHFDRLFIDHIQTLCPPNAVSTTAFVYCHSGRTFDDRGPRACPYIAYDQETRLMVGQKEKFLSHLVREFARAPRATRGYRRLLLKIARSLRPLLPPELAKRTAKTPGLELLEFIAGSGL